MENPTGTEVIPNSSWQSKPLRTQKLLRGTRNLVPISHSDTVDGFSDLLEPSKGPDGTVDNPYLWQAKPGASDELYRRLGMENNGGLIGSKVICGMAPSVQLGFQKRGPLLEDRCLICSLDEHTSPECPYQAEVPKNAIVGRGCVVVCKVCRHLFSGRCCDQDSGHAELKYCIICWKLGEHWPERCPQVGNGVEVWS